LDAIRAPQACGLRKLLNPFDAELISLFASITQIHSYLSKTLLQVFVNVLILYMNVPNKT
jgi:hypothetical protein